ncbi:putative SPBc2 prophage-derived single-strand DNA-specific exonuclease YorK [Rossellomorea marisflavi]|uniref:DHH family phosphoesterase n=1 Tax=Rossellomorea marisflavi TaxID=189381 RepID=UPI0025CB7077|nr:DHH family phosphoesterase [Rossellomorea marisflavi]GLI82556.1 putative SPBc2 prophage-derived single-strand DNA-specific exonuclease YorK [Rossellomorea marisflavi]
MKYQLKGENNLDNIIETIFSNRGVRDVDRFINLDESVLCDYSALSNIQVAVELILKHVRNNSKIFVQVDSDCDGYTSAAIIINYLNKVFNHEIDLVWRLQEGKEHGVELKNVPEDTNLVILPDSGSNQIREHRELNEKGIDVLVLDHHECSEESRYGVIVNNQLSPNYKNKNLSGAGVCYKFCQALDKELGLNLADYYLDLAALGNVADIMDVRELETRYLIKKGFENVNNPLFREIVEKQSYSMRGAVNIHTVGFYVAPLINAGIRYGSKELKEQMMRALLEVEEKIYYKKQDKYETLAKATARELSNARSRQNKQRDKSVEGIEDNIQSNNLHQDKVILCNVDGLLGRNLTGLVANQLVRKYKRPVILYRKDKEKGMLSGSARGYEKGEVRDFKKLLLATGLFEYCEGHGNAFGHKFKSEKLDLLRETLNNQLQMDVDHENIYEVDFVLEEKQISDRIIYEINKYKNEWGGKLEEPKIYLKGVGITPRDAKLIGKKNNTLKIHYREGIELVKFFTKQDDFEKMFADGESIYFDAVVKCSVNEYDGKITPQFEIIDIRITDVLYF